MLVLMLPFSPALREYSQKPQHSKLHPIDCIYVLGMVASERGMRFTVFYVPHELALFLIDNDPNASENCAIICYLNRQHGMTLAVKT